MIKVMVHRYVSPATSYPIPLLLPRLTWRCLMRSILCEGSASASSSSLLISPSLSSNTSLRHHQVFRKRTCSIKWSRRTRAGHMCLRQSPLAHPTIPMAYLELCT